MKKKIIFLILALVAVCCLCMAYVDGVLQPGYLKKSVIKIVLFVLVPCLYGTLDPGCNLKKLLIPNSKGFLLAFYLGIGLYILILGAYFLFRGLFDFSALTSSLTASTGVSRDNFLWVAVYISVANSFLEEFFFRGFAFLTLREQAGERFAYLFSAGAFTVYHIAMMIGWFAWPVLVLTLVGLFAGGLIFDNLNQRFGNIYPSWLVHMFTNLSINTIGWILFRG